MTEISDQQLLDRVRADAGDRQALDELARRYVRLVYTLARRQVRDAHLAEDVTQAVFIVLVRKAGSIRRDAALASWLFTVTRHAVSNALRVRARRRHHETRVVLMSQGEFSHDDPDRTDMRDIRPMLDDAIARLPDADRCGVLLHFFAGQTHRQVGEALGLSEEAARKRVGRALEKMRIILEGRGIGATTAAGVAAALAAEGSASAALAPPAATLCASAVNAALLADSVIASGAAPGALSIAKGIAHMMTIAKVKIAASIAGAVLLAGAAVAVPIISQSQSAGVAGAVLTTTTTTLGAPATQPGTTIDVSERVRIHLMGVSTFPPDADSWFAFNGQPIDLPDEKILNARVNATPEPQNVVALRVEKPESATVRLQVQGAEMNAVSQDGDDMGTILVSAFRLGDGANAKTATIEIGISEKGWNTIATYDKLTEPAEVQTDVGVLSFDPMDSADRGARVEVRHESIDSPTQMVAIDEAGKEFKASNINVRGDGQTWTTTCDFEIPGERVKKVLFQTRSVGKIVQVSDISLEKGQVTEPKIQVKDGK
jgi:RNA polymerase sigma factor (sigma-70 family)